MKNKVLAITCEKCGDTIFSRAQHDYHSCSCRAVSIDGGKQYLRVLWNEKEHKRPTCFELKINQTDEQLYNDWNLNKNKYGTIKRK
jgi:hypothetical protein